MGSRGRGRGKASMSISAEQLGFGKGETLPPPVLQPPPKYPLREYKPQPFKFTTEISYLLELKRDFAEFMRESPDNVQCIVVKKDIERYSDRYQDLVADKVNYADRYDWSRLPQELKPVMRKRKVGKAAEDSVKLAKEKKKKKKENEVDIEKKLQELEQTESNQQSDVEEEDKTEEDAEEKDADEPIEEEEEVDEEMDDGTDYFNNYFDNGEGYDEEEDNVDDGPIY